jgi:hypothetical protein
MANPSDAYKIYKVQHVLTVFVTYEILWQSDPSQKAYGDMVTEGPKAVVNPSTSGTVGIKNCDRGGLDSANSSQLVISFGRPNNPGSPISNQHAKHKH